MEFTLLKASKPDFEETVEINTIEDLKAIPRPHNCGLVVYFRDGEDRPFNSNEIWIYDGYLE